MRPTAPSACERPITAIDVDGVLNPWLKPEYGEWLLALADRSELVWATSWEHAANWHIAPRIGLPELEVIEFPGLVKLPAMEAWCGSRPLAWLDDSLGQTAFAWAADRNARAQTLLIPVDPHQGLQREQCSRVSIWLDALAATSR